MPKEYQKPTDVLSDYYRSPVPNMEDGMDFSRFMPAIKNVGHLALKTMMGIGKVFQGAGEATPAALAAAPYETRADLALVPTPETGTPNQTLAA